MDNKEFVLVEISGEPKLKMRFYKPKADFKGILVFVHGVSHGAWCWENFVNFFTEIGYACFALNLCGHGDNDKHDIKGVLLSDYVIDVIRCIEYIENNHNNPEIDIPYSKPYIVGHSMGGSITEKYISNFSHRVKGAVLLAPVTAEGMGIIKILTTSFSLRGIRTSFTTFLERKICLSKSNFFAVKNGLVCRTRISKEAIKNSKRLLCRESFKAMLGLRKFKLNNPNIPVFVIGSDKDAYFPTKSLNKTADFYGTKPMVLRGLCHDVMLDSEWEKAAQSVLTFIERPDELKSNPEKFIDDLWGSIYPKGT